MEIPKSLNECKRTDGTVSAVRFWAENFEKWGERILVFLLVIGVIETILSGISAAEIDEEMVFGVVISSLIQWFFYAVIEYAAYNFISTILYALGSIVESARTSANVELYKLYKDEIAEGREREDTTYWTCSECGKRNPKHTGTCSCGHSRY